MAEWRPVLGHESDYQVNEYGDVWSRPRKGTRGGLRSRSVNKHGYWQVSLVTNGEQTVEEVHRLVASAFLGVRPTGHEVRHLDGNKLNSHVGNLAYGTVSQNQLDSVAHGTHGMSRKTHCSNGHPFDEANTRRYRGRRYCKACA